MASPSDGGASGALDVPYRERERSITLERMERPVEGTARPSEAELAAEEGQDTELFTINMGPHHPATHGVLRLMLTLQGETVRELVPLMGYVHTGIEKSCEDQAVLEGHPVRRADGLPLLLLQRADLLHGRRAAARRGGPEARAVPAGDPHGAQPDLLAPVLARHLGARPGRDLDALVLAARPRDVPRPVRGLERPAHAHALLPGRRGDRGPAAGLGRALPGPPGPDVRAHRPVRGAARHQRDLPAAHEGRGGRLAADHARARA